MKHLDLFSGIGGFALAARAVGWETVGFCDIDTYCQDVLRERWPGVPIYDDVRTLDGRAVGSVGIVTGGYPCQPFSLAGKRGGANDDRHLWPAMCRIIDELRPAWVVGENVAGHITMGLDDVLSDLERIGYACRPFAIPAVAVDAKHRRERIWIVANRDSGRLEGERRSGLLNGERPTLGGDANGRDSARPSAYSESNQDRGVCQSRLQSDARAGSEPAMAHAARHEQGRQEQRTERQRVRPSGQSESLSNATERGRRQGDQDAGGSREGTGAAEERRGLTEPCRWEPEPDVGRVAHGIPARAHRLRALGNAIVPQVAEEIFRAIAAVSSGNP